MSDFGIIGDLAGKATDKVVDGIDEGIDKGKKLVGEAADYATDKAGQYLEAHGHKRAADLVTDWGDGFASSMGAEVGEQQLGQTEEPNELIHGNPTKIADSVKNLRDFQLAFDLVGAGMKKLDSSNWKGEAADTFRTKFSTLPTDWLHAADAFEAAAGALERYSNAITSAQAMAREAIVLYKQGRQASAAHEKDVTAYESARESDKPLPKPGADPGKALCTRAQEILSDARRARNEAAEQAKTAVTSAMAHAPKEPKGREKLKLELADWSMASGTEGLHLLGGVTKGAAGLINFVRSVNPMDGYNLTHPAEYYKGVNMTLAGLVSTVANPDRALKNAWEAAKGDPAEFLGRLIPELIGTKGAGVLRGGLRAGMRSGTRHGGLDGPGRNGVQDPADPSRTARGAENDPSDPIDLATGVMYLPQTDIALPGTLPLVFRRRLASDYRAGRWFGPSWSSTADQRLEIDSEGVVLIAEDGLLLAYPHPAPGVPVLPSHGPRWPLDRDVDGGYTVTDPESGRVRHFVTHHDELALLTQIDDRNGNWVTFEYDDETGAPTAIVHSGGYHLKLTTCEDRITALHLAGGAPDGSDQEILRYGYTDGHLTEVVNSSGIPLRFAYDERGRLTSWTDTNGRRYEYTYDDRDRCITEGGVEGHMALRLDYDGTDPETGLRVTRATTGTGAVHQYVVNDAHQIVKEIDPLGAVTHFERDRYNRLLSRTDPLGRTTRFEYDASGRRTSAIRPDGRALSAEYNELGLPVRVTNPNHTSVRQEYDERGNRVAVTDPAGAVTRFTLSEAGHTTAVTDGLGNTTRLRNDAAGLPVEMTDPLGAVTRFRHDAFGRPVVVTDPLGHTTRLEWTPEGKLARRVEADGTEQSWTYDGEGNCLTHTDPMGRVSRFEYTHFDLISARTGPDGVRYEFTHDHELRLTQVLNPQGLTWDYEYDAAGHLISETDFDGRTITYARDAAGRLVSRTDALGQTIHYERDELDRVTRKDAAGAVTTYTYDLFDQLAEARNADATITYLRDRHGRLKSETVNGRTLTYAYDKLGRRTGRTTPTGAVSTWVYDAAGRRTSLTTSGRTLLFEHDAAGQEITRHIGDTITYTSQYDSLGRLTSQQVTGAGGRGIQRRDYAYRADGNLIGIDDQLTGSRTFDLDASGRVTAVEAAGWTERYAYDEAGNQTHASWPASHAGQEATGPRAYAGTVMTRAGNVRYEHDALGRITLRQKSRLSRKPDTWRYEWDAENRMRSVTTPDGTVWRYEYDALGRRTAKQRLAPDGRTVVEKTIFTWDGVTLCEETSESEALPKPVAVTWDYHGLRPLTQTERILAPTAARETIDERFFSIVTDLIGTPRELVDETGDLAWSTRTTLWGTTTWAASSTAHTSLRFPGQRFDPETGLHYNLHRYYDPETGRYLTSDPLGLAPAANSVTYVPNPHSQIDPFGLFGCPEEEHLFRGTTEGYNASVNIEKSGFTPTSTDPGVAATFARHSEQFGDAVLQLIPRSALEGVPMERGFIRAEAEVGVGLHASELAKRASVTIPSSVAKDILDQMGIKIPKLHTYQNISDALEWDIPKLTPDQISQFVAEAYKYARG
ncbi:putative T7SS-secreted protein [Streptomyces sp. NPDC016309]|uniref:putative T7SS-secreted protein n=1 Tax=Streptomyces sp. NPDC016309 TaxID=3364965 RepID=UPI0036FA9B9E